MATLNRNNSNWSFEERRKINENWDILESLSNSTASGNNGLKSEVDQLKITVGQNTNRITNSIQLSNQANSKSDNAILRANEANSKSDNAVLTANEANEKSEYVQSQFDKVVSEGDSNAEVVQARSEFENLRQRLDSEKQEFDNNLTLVDTRLTTQLTHITLFVDDFERLTTETDDTGRINRALAALKVTGGELKFNSEYTVSGRLNYEFENDVRVILTATTNSLIKSTTLDYVLNISSSNNIGDVEIYNLNFNASAAGTHFDTTNRTQGITVIGVRTVKIEGCKISNLYGTGIMCNNNRTVDINNNVLLNVRGYSLATDNYGDGIYVSSNTKQGNVKNNYIYNQLSSTQRCGRIGITLEFDVANINVKGNFISGYNRAIHDELTFGGHIIEGNTVEACLIPYINVTPKGNSITLIQNNRFSTAGFLFFSELRFRLSAIAIGTPQAGHTPKFRCIGNIIDIVNTQNALNLANLENAVATTSNNVEFEKNVINCDPSANGRNFAFGSRSNISVKQNQMNNMKVFTLWFGTNISFEDNEVSAESFAVDRSTIKFNRNTIRPSSTVTNLGNILNNRPQGQFNNNIVYDYGSTSINNTNIGVNTEVIELSGNQFIKTLATTPALPLTRTSDPNQCDVFFSNSPNTVTDNFDGSDPQQLNFYGGTRFVDGRRLSYSNAAPTTRTWGVGDKIVNINPSTGIKEWVCVTAGAPGVFRQIRFAEV